MWPSSGSLEKCNEGARPAVGAGRCGRRTAVPPGFRVPLVLHVPDAGLTLVWTRRGVEALKLQLLTGLETNLPQLCHLRSSPGGRTEPCVRACACVHSCMHACACVCIHACVCMRVSACVCMRACVCMCVETAKSWAPAAESGGRAGARGRACQRAPRCSSRRTVPQCLTFSPFRFTMIIVTSSRIILKRSFCGSESWQMTTSSTISFLDVSFQFGLKKTLLKPPGGAGRLARRSSSRGSAPGPASGACASPAAGRGRCAVWPLRLLARNRLGSTEGSGRLAWRDCVRIPALEGLPL